MLYMGIYFFLFFSIVLRRRGKRLFFSKNSKCVTGNQET